MPDNPTYPTYQALAAMSKAELGKVACRCVSCLTCHGSGRENYDDGFPCDDCDGGFMEICDRCRLLIEIDHDEEDARNVQDR